MPRNLNLPRLKPMTLGESSLTYVCSTWVMPKSQIQIPICSFSGTLGTKTSIEKDICFMRWRSEELISLVKSSKGIILDLRQISFETNVVLDVVPSVIRSRQYLVRVVVRPEAFDTVNGSFFTNEITTDYESIFSDLAFELKDYRLDKCRQMQERPQLPPPQLIPISLDISSIGFECYTWRYNRDVSDSGYVVFQGQYRYGSAGGEDALLIKWRLNQFCDALQPSRLIVDLRELDYQWGDDLSLYPFHFLDPESKICFILTPQQVSYYKSTIYPSNICIDEVAALRDLGCI
ncbi:hypothetical protein [Limnofasciculus baicalensis]|uniref:Uncharacterized protein n=1 Tax=Limnofasciculus baicalensis BBK-W-15 TaxID=2699891 RepID=A0AAE3KPG1_9CYAN|nr:hypothetical protein [Limnofasciculus baicalensis]MCP2731505.1 hypothetical protein [Limnofasciculus baicalensis BBK-W-15]